MALIKWSGLVSEIKGKLNGSIFQGGAYGQVMRNRISGGGFLSSRWLVRRREFALISSSWRSLSKAQQDTWISQAVNYTFVDKFGNPYNPSGYILYNSLNHNRHTLGMPLLTIAPSPPTQEDIAPINASFTPPNTLQVSWTPTSNNDYAVMLYVSPALSTGVRHIKRRFILIGVKAGSTGSPANIGTSWEINYGPFPSSGRLIVNAKVIHRPTGRGYGDLIAITDI